MHPPLKTVGPGSPAPSPADCSSRPGARGFAALAALALLALLAGAAALAGCGGGGGGHSAAPSGPSDANGIASSVATSDLGNGRVEVSFTLSTPVAKAVGVDVDFSQDRGLNYSAASLDAAPANPASLPASPDGVPHSVVWRVTLDLGNLSQHDLRMKISPYDAASHAPGISGESAIFGLGSNTPPQVSSLTAPAGPRGGWITLQYTVADADGDYVEIEGQYSSDGGSTYHPATLDRGDGATAVAATPSGTAHTIGWNAQGDLPDVASSSVRVRLRAADTSPGSFATSGLFAIDTRGPSIDLLTIDGIPAVMNGSLAFTNTQNQSQSFSLMAADRTFVIWVSFAAGSSALDPAGLTVWASEPLGGGAGGGGVDPGSSFGSRFQVSLADGLATLTVGDSLAFTSGSHTVTAQISDVLGNSSPAVSYVFQAGPATSSLRPFRSAERWHIDFSRDNWSISSSINHSGTVTVTSTSGANGVADFVEDLRMLGLQSASPPPAAASAGLNEVVLAAIEEAVIGHLYELYGKGFDGSAGADSVQIEFSLTAPGGTHSRMAIGGDDPMPGYTIGRAEFDYRNSIPNDDSATDLGVFTTNLIDFYINTSFTFRSRFNPLIPGRGTALGFNSDDVTVLSPSFNRSSSGNTVQQNRRYDDIELAIDGIARSVSVIAAHEIGHSLGLVANGAPTAGLFGGEYLASFAGPYTNSYHLDSPGNDIMAASLSFTSSITTGPAGPKFNELTMAYLLERILLE
jgi:hypothetical protein